MGDGSAAGAPAGHVFVVRADVTRIACDAWLLPTDAGLAVDGTWRPRGAAVDRLADGRLRHDVPGDWGDDGRRAAPIDDWLGDEEDRPATWLANVGGPRAADACWVVEGVSAFVRDAAEDLRRTGTPPRHRRACHLVAVPLADGAGAALRRGTVLVELLPAMARAARDAGVDVVLVAASAQAFAAAQVARGRSATELGTATVWAALDPALLDAAEDLGRRAREGHLVLFLGAGVSAGAGAPLWSRLLEGLAEAADMDAADIARLARMDVLDQALIIESAFAEQARPGGASDLEAEGRRRLGEHVCRLVARHRYALGHSLLAGLPTREAVTLNYDQLFEQAVKDVGERISVVPYEPVEPGSRWLLKLHGCVSDPDAIVLTRTDHLRYGDERGALAGIVQALLVTRHVLFVGFGLDDENFHRIADTVRRSVHRTARASEGAGAMGTALVLQEDALRARLWADELRTLPMSSEGAPAPDADEGGRTAAAARRLEIFLDRVLSVAAPTRAHVGDDASEPLLSDDERAIKALIGGVLARVPARPDGSEAWQPLQDALRAYGVDEAVTRG